MEVLEEGDESRGLRRAEVLAVGRHVAAALDDLADEVVLRQAPGDVVEGGAALAAALLERMAVAALLDLEDQRALSLEGGRTLEESRRHRIAAPGIHVWAPGGELGQACERPQRHRDEQDGEDRDRTPAPALLAFAGEERKQEQGDDADDGSEEEHRRLQGRGKQREQRIEPEEEVVRAGGARDD